MNELTNKTTKGVMYSGASVSIAAMIVAILIKFYPNMTDISTILIGGLTPIINGILIVIKIKLFSNDTNN